MDSILKGKKVLLTAGPTQEPIDPVRYISNYSSGKMGIAIAEEFMQRGAEVTLIKGPSNLVASKNIFTENVQTAEEMFLATNKHFPNNEIVIFAAAVADYTPKNPAAQKIKKKESDFTLELVKTKDIAFEMGKIKASTQYLVGFALETENELANAKGKLIRKNLDMIVLNSTQDKGAGFQTDTNLITIVDKQENIRRFELKTKQEVAIDIVNYIEKKMKNE